MILKTSRDDYLQVKLTGLGRYSSIKLIQRAFNNLHLNTTSTQRSSSIAELNHQIIRSHLSISKSVMDSDVSNSLHMRPA